MSKRVRVKVEIRVRSEMTLEERQRMALLEGTLRAVRRLNELAKQDPCSIPLEDAMDGRLLQEWKKISRQIDALAPP